MIPMRCFLNINTYSLFSIFLGTLLAWLVLPFAWAEEIQVETHPSMLGGIHDTDTHQKIIYKGQPFNISFFFDDVTEDGQTVTLHVQNGTNLYYSANKIISTVYGQKLPIQEKFIEDQIKKRIAYMIQSNQTHSDNDVLNHWVTQKSQKTSSELTKKLFPRFTFIEPQIQKSLAVEIVTSGYPFSQNMRAEFRYTVEVEILNKPENTSFINGSRIEKLCLRIQAEEAKFWCKQYKILEPTLPIQQQQPATTLCFFDVIIELGLGTTIFQLVGDTGSSPALIIDVIPDSNDVISPTPSIVLPVTTSSAAATNSAVEKLLPAISIAVFGSLRMGGQQILDLAKCRELVHRDDIAVVHFIAETMDGILNSEYLALAEKESKFFIHHLPNLLENHTMATLFLKQKLEWMSSINHQDQISAASGMSYQWSILTPLQTLLSTVKVLNVPNSICSPKLFNMLHVARLSGVLVRVVDLPNVRVVPSMMIAATALVGPSNFACNHPDATVLKIPCFVIYPVAIANINATTQVNVKDEELERDAWDKGGHRYETGHQRAQITFAFVGRTSPERSPGIFFHAAHILHSRMENLGVVKVNFIVIGHCNDYSQKVFNDLFNHSASLTESRHISINIQFIGVVEYKKVLTVLKEWKVDVLVNTRSLETFGISIVEGMSIGIPSIVCHGSGHPEIVSNLVNGMLVDCNAKSIANAMEQLAINDSLRKKLARSSLNPISLEKFSSVNFVKRYGDLFQRLVQQNDETNTVKEELSWVDRFSYKMEQLKELGTLVGC
jgi:glycosyltransferase involved in cell wall biosynthesis